MTYRTVCEIGKNDMDSGASSFTLLRSGAQKLCRCDDKAGINNKELRKEMDEIADLSCSGNLFGPMSVLDGTFDECQRNVINLDDYSTGDGKLSDGLMQTEQNSFPTAVWDDVSAPRDCKELEASAKGRMMTYRTVCEIGKNDMDSGASSFTLLRSGAQKLCRCDDKAG